MDSLLGSEEDWKTVRGTVFPTNARDIGTALHLLVEAFQRVRALQPGPMPGAKSQAGQNNGLALIHQRGKLWPAGTELVGHMTPDLMAYEVR